MGKRSESLVILLVGLVLTMLASTHASGQGDDVAVTFRLVLEGPAPDGQVFSLGVFPPSDGGGPGLVGPALDHFCGYGNYGECAGGKAYTIRLDVARGSRYVYDFRRQPLDGSAGELLCVSTVTFRRDTLIQCHYERQAGAMHRRTPVDAGESPAELPQTGAGGMARRDGRVAHRPAAALMLLPSAAPER